MSIFPRLVSPLRVLQAFVLATWAAGAAVQASPEAVTKSANFDADPQWEGFNNRMTAQKATTISQDFGYSPTHFAGTAGGEVGGVIQRSMRPAFYAKKIEPKSLKDKLSASGTFAITKSGGSSGVFFGWFNEKKIGSSGRPTNSLGMCFDIEPSGGRLAVYLITANNKCWGNFVTPYIPGTYRPTPIKSDGSVRYTWRLDYDPEANSGNGQFTFTIKGDGPNPANFENRKLTVDIPPELRNDETVFDRFGMMNLLVDGGSSTVYFDDLQFNDSKEEFSQEPRWDGSRNRGTFTESEPHGVQNFGYSDTSFAGGKRGEIGGIFWRDVKGGHYADRVGPLTLEDRLEASGKVNLVVGGTDADMTFGWFHSEQPTGDKAKVERAGSPNFLGVHIGGPTRVGHYFLPQVITASGSSVTSQPSKRQPKAGPVMIHNQETEWS
ncbi:MAG TPA: hypothetical protein VK968_10435, partial [Roseimicrobium sp.]|nr:hypothetical protein [Roseimicrobium sp.]